VQRLRHSLVFGEKLKHVQPKAEVEVEERVSIIHTGRPHKDSRMMDFLHLPQKGTDQNQRQNADHSLLKQPPTGLALLKKVHQRKGLMRMICNLV
jgi:hypothetical protein